MLYKYICFSILLTGSISNCSQPAPVKYKSPEGYNLNKPFLIKLPIELDEISGLAFYPKDSSVFAITDEFGWLYKIFLTRQGQIQKWKFSDQGDYEDVALVDSFFYVLRSKGDITAFTVRKNNEIIREEVPFPLQGNEFEILYYDSSIKKLKLICKDCEADKKRALTGFIFDPATARFSDSTFSIDATAIAKSLNEDKIRFKPSAASINPVTHELFMISSINKLLVITDLKGKFKSAYTIDPKLFKQPEGLTFTPAGDLIISNEAADKGVANILVFKYHGKKMI